MMTRRPAVRQCRRVLPRFDRSECSLVEHRMHVVPGAAGDGATRRIGGAGGSTGINGELFCVTEELDTAPSTWVTTTNEGTKDRSMMR